MAKLTQPSEAQAEKRLPPWALWVGFGVYFILYSSFAIAVLLGWLGERPEAGQFGDAFGVVNAFFSGLAFVGIAVTIYIQHRQLELQREELRLSREELKLTRDELKSSAVAQALSADALREQVRLSSIAAEVAALPTLIEWNASAATKCRDHISRLSDARGTNMPEKVKKLLANLTVQERKREDENAELVLRLLFLQQKLKADNPNDLRL